MAGHIASEGFAGRWENIPKDLAEALKKILPPNVVKSIQYDLKKDPARYVSSTSRICEAIGDSCCFLPTRRINIPCHHRGCCSDIHTLQGEGRDEKGCRKQRGTEF